MFDTLRRAFQRVLTGFVIFQMAALAVVILYAVACRKLGVSLVWYDEVASIQLAWLTYFGATLFASAWGPVALMSVWSDRITASAAFWGIVSGFLGNTRN